MTSSCDWRFSLGLDFPLAGESVTNSGPGANRAMTFTIEFLDPGVDAFSFTFG